MGPVPIATLILLTGLLLPLPTQPAEPNPHDFDDPDEADLAERNYHKAVRKRVRYAIGRLIFQAAGIIALIVGAFGLSAPENTEALALLTALFGSLILLVQRTEDNRRIATLVFMAFCGLIIWNYATFREYTAEANVSLYLSLLVNFLFWVTIGQRYPVGSSQEIYVWGMDD